LTCLQYAHTNACPITSYSKGQHSYSKGQQKATLINGENKTTSGKYR